MRSEFNEFHFEFGDKELRLCLFIWCIKNCPFPWLPLSRCTFIIFLLYFYFT